MKRIKLTKGKIAIVDDDVYEQLNKHKWYTMVCRGSTYAVRFIFSSGSPKKTIGTIYMHREILQVPQGKMVDHIDGDGLNNRRANLRVATRRENGRNRKKRISKYPGVYPVGSWKQIPHRKSTSKQWYTGIYHNGKFIYAGSFYDEEECYQAYLELCERLGIE